MTKNSNLLWYYYMTYMCDLLSMEFNIEIKAKMEENFIKKKNIIYT